MTDTLAKRLGHLIETRHRGSVNSAAKAMGIPQRTLHAVVTGEVTNPRAELLTRISDFHQISLDWLLRGEGKGPDVSDPLSVSEEVFTWYQVVIGLRIPDERIHNAMLELPKATAGGAMTFAWSRDRGTKRRVKGHPTGTLENSVSPRIIEAIRLEHKAWTLLLQDFIDDVGPERARKEIMFDEAWIRTRFVGELYIDMVEKIAKERDAAPRRGIEGYVEDYAKAAARTNPIKKPDQAP